MRTEHHAAAIREVSGAGAHLGRKLGHPVEVAGERRSLPPLGCSSATPSATEYLSTEYLSIGPV